jgi:streptogramin lyase
LPKIQNIQPSPAGITVAGGKLWFVEQFTDSIGMLDPADPTHPQSFSQGLSSAPSELTTGPDGNIWFTQPLTGAIGMLEVSNSAHTIHNYVLPRNPTRVPSDITVGKDQTGKSVLWYSDPTNNAIGMIDPTNPSNPPAEITLPNTLVGGLRSQITAEANGTLWFSEATYNPTTQALIASAIGSYNPATAQWSEVALPSGSAQAPFGITIGPDQHIWFGEAVVNTGTTGGNYVSSALGTINPTVTPLTVTEYPIPLISANTARLPFRMVAGPDGNIWFTDNASTAVVKFSLADHSFTPYDAPKVTAFDPIPFGITAGAGGVWFTDNGGAVDKVTITSPLVPTTNVLNTSQNHSVPGQPVQYIGTVRDINNNIPTLGSYSFWITDNFTSWQQLGNWIPIDSNGQASITRTVPLGVKVEAVVGFYVDVTANYHWSWSVDNGPPLFQIVSYHSRTSLAFNSAADSLTATISSPESASPPLDLTGTVLFKSNGVAIGTARVVNGVAVFDVGRKVKKGTVLTAEFFSDFAYSIGSSTGSVTA